MIAYLDSSVILRIVLGAEDKLREWKDVELGVTSAIAEVECLRTLDRIRVAGELDAESIVERRDAVYRILSETEVVEVDGVVLRRASMPLPVPLGTLDAIHLASAACWSESTGKAPVVATHDLRLARAARSIGYAVAGA